MTNNPSNIIIYNTIDDKASVALYANDVKPSADGVTFATSKLLYV